MKYAARDNDVFDTQTNLPVVRVVGSPENLQIALDALNSFGRDDEVGLLRARLDEALAQLDAVRAVVCIN